VRLSDLPPEVQTYDTIELMPMLSSDERDHLSKVEGKWPQYAHALMKAASRHEVLPPPLNKPRVTTYEALPREWKMALPGQRLMKDGSWARLRQVEGKWPEFALIVTELAGKEWRDSRDSKDSKERHKFGPRPFGPLSPLGACRPKEFSPAIQLFLEEKLRPVLTDAEKKRLSDTEGKWPEYPRLLVRLATEHQLVVPGMMMPEF
jgi:hypothetical protein